MWRGGEVACGLGARQRRGLVTGLLVACAAAGCGRVGFQTVGPRGNDSGPPDSGGDGGDAARDAGGGPPPDGSDRPDDGCPPAETCNGRDDDCDGTIDEGTCRGDCGVRHRGGHAYLFCDAAVVDWMTAREGCTGRGYHLVKIETPEEDTWLWDQVEDFSGGTSFEWWIGLNDRATEGTFVWHDDTTLMDTGYANWGPEEPNDNNDQDCVDLDGPLYGGGWDDHQCDDDGPEFEHHYICESS